MSSPDPDTERDLGQGLRLRIPSSWQVQADANGTLVRDPATGLNLRVFCKPSAKGAVALERLAELGLAHLMKTQPDCKRMGEWQREEGQGWQGRVQMMSGVAGGKPSRILYTAFILADEADLAKQNNISVLLQAPDDVFQARAGYFRLFVPARLLAGTKPAPVAGGAPAAKVELQPAQPPPPRASAAQAAVQPAAQAPGDDREEDLHLAARGQKLVIYSIVLNFLFGALTRSVALPDPVFLGLGLVVAGFNVYGVIKICSGLGKSQGSKLAFMMATSFPLINLVVLVFLSVQATRLLRSAGWEVGLLGARE